MERLSWLEVRVAPTLEAMGFEVVRIAVTSGARKTLQVMADRRDGSLISVEDCAEISQALSAIFDVEEPLNGAYDLEISSAGIDRPLTRPKDFATYAGFEAKVETKAPLAGRKRFRGLLKGMNSAGEVVIDVDGVDIAVPMEAIGNAKLVLTDALIAATAAGKACNENIGGPRPAADNDTN
ncbi:MAG: ribosome maturation factor RimP [Rhodospirillaceae bacterium]|nr:MAG: ribosome maturation factor RimP [Rhodospirillaceae bacterium]